MNVWLENQGDRRCVELMSALLAFFENSEIGVVKRTTWFQAPKMAKKSIFFAGKESSDSATTDSETLGVCGQ